MGYFGCHLSASGGNAVMVKTALSIGANTFAFFTRNPRGSKAKPEDPADTAILYGKLNAAMWTVMPVLTELVQMPDAHIHLEPDLQGGETRVRGKVGITARIWDLTVMGFACGVPLIKWFLRLRKQPQPAAKGTDSLPRKDEKNGKQENQPQRNDGDRHEQGAGDGEQ